MTGDDNDLLSPENGDSKLSSADVSGEGETFEDAQDIASESASDSEDQHRSPKSSTRSLTERRPSSSSTTKPFSPSTQETPRLDDNHEDTPPTSDMSDPEKTPSRLPRLSAHRISTTSLDDVNLEGDPGGDLQSSAVSHGPPKPPPRESTNSILKLQGLSANLPSVPWSPPPPPPTLHEKSSAPSPTPPPARKLTSPFSWLSRGTSGTKEASPPPGSSHAVPSHDRRNTTSSLATLNSNPELMLNRLDDGHDSDGSGHQSRNSGRNSLRDRFKLLRLREEAGIASLNEDSTGGNSGGGAIAGLVGRSTGLGIGVASPTSLTEEKEGASINQHGMESPSPKSPIPPALDPKLAPGTASGISAGPSAFTDPAAPVDWDLWQAVVYEGPAAVARTSPEELNRAIAGGIPSAIRGVVWQVLAQSKNEELEGVYRDLVARGTEKDKDRNSGSSNSGKHEPFNGQLNGGSKDKDSMTSSRSSTRSGHSTPATSATNGVMSPTLSQQKDEDSMRRLQEQLLEEKKIRAKADAVALQKLEKAIRRDMGSRTSYSKYAVAAGLQDGLFGVCKAYALFDEGVGYAQGMNFLVMPLLFNMPEEEAFCLLVRLMNHYGVRDMFIQDMPGLHLHLYQFERLLEDLEPALYCHLHRRGVNPQLYATQWFLTLFAYRFPLQLVLRIYDLILSEGLEGAILKFGVVLMQKNAQTLLSMKDMSQLTTFLKERLFDVYIDQTPSASSVLESGFFGSSGGIDKEVYRADILVQDACSIKITPETLKGYTAEWEEKIRIERDREAEVDSLKSANVSLAHKVRSLEERVEKFDTEHVMVASDLVRTKVENEEFKDENESLKSQVAELRALVERQPQEVEDRLKEDMDRIMKRNLEVHNENQALEEQMAEMEKNLVETKMQYAEVNANYEALKQKWNDLRKAIEN